MQDIQIKLVKFTDFPFILNYLYNQGYDISSYQDVSSHLSIADRCERELPLYVYTSSNKVYTSIYPLTSIDVDSFSSFEEYRKAESKRLNDPAMYVPDTLDVVYKQLTKSILELPDHIDLDNDVLETVRLALIKTVFPLYDTIKCPRCRRDYVSNLEKEFVTKSNYSCGLHGELDPHYRQYEAYICPNCNKHFSVINGT